MNEPYTGANYAAVVVACIINVECLGDRKYIASACLYNNKRNVSSVSLPLLGARRYSVNPSIFANLFFVRPIPLDAAKRRDARVSDKVPQNFAIGRVMWQIRVKRLSHIV